MRILLVEDDPHIGDGIAAGLKKLGMAVDWFSDGAQGQSAPLAAPYDAAVLDLGLPNIDGIEILRHWRKQCSTKFQGGCARVGRRRLSVRFSRRGNR